MVVYNTIKYFISGLAGKLPDKENNSGDRCCIPEECQNNQ